MDGIGRGTSRDDWIAAALALLLEDGVEGVKIARLADRVGVSRSGFYWHFKGRQDVLDALLEHWENTNSAVIIRQAQEEAATICEAVLNVFLGFVDPNQFDNRLDFAIRDWARRDEAVARKVRGSERVRVRALARMFGRFGFEDARVRARVLYYMQIGYNDAELQETMEARLQQLRDYLRVFTGQEATEAELARFAEVAATWEEQP